MKVPTALEAADVFVDVFDEVLTQIFQGEKMIQVSNPTRIAPSEEQLSHTRKLRSKISMAIDDLLNTVVNTDQNTTVKDELANAALDQERKVLENLDKRIDIVKRLLEMHKQLEPNSIVKMVGQYIMPPPELGK